MKKDNLQNEGIQDRRKGGAEEEVDEEEIQTHRG